MFDSLIRGPSDEGESTNLGLGLYITKEIVAAHGGQDEAAAAVSA
jgi:signal transduction histidine kinase